MKFHLREASIKDTEAIAKLTSQLGYSSTNEAIKMRLRELIAHTEHCVYVASDQEGIKGWIHGFYSLQLESDAFAEIGGLVVDESCRKMGIGKGLIEEVRTWAKTKRCKKLRVRCNVIRKESHVFYEKMGFTLVKEQKIFDQKIQL